MNKTPAGWSAVRAEAVTSGSVAQATNVLQMALDDIAVLAHINANLMGDDENVPRYTTKRLKQEIQDRHGRLLGIEVAASALADHVRKSLNVGPLSKSPSKEARLWRALREALSTPVENPSRPSKTTVASLYAAVKALCDAYPESDEDNSIENLWGRYGSGFAVAVRDARQAAIDYRNWSEGKE